MAKRTNKMIEEDCKRIKEAAKTATSFKELEQLTGLSYSAINTTLQKHPIIQKRIKEQIANNKELIVLPGNFTSQGDVKVDDTENGKKYVIDASISGVDSILEFISNRINEGHKIVFTSVSIHEFTKLQLGNDQSGFDARHILNSAAENPDNFETVLIDENYESPDDCIIQYCAKEKENVVLLTSDKNMALRARCLDVEVQFLKKATKTSAPIPPPKRYFDNNKHQISLCTLYPAFFAYGQLIINEFTTSTRAIAVWSGNSIYTNGTKQLMIGDDVLVASKKLNYITFAHYKVKYIRPQDNCEFIYSARVYNKEDVKHLNKDYKSFVNDFKIKCDL
ncbi:MAG: hypothetical protein PHP54_02035 [Clostridia bacterium]|nr:hypothetical protein [Clostridia bacterium]